MSSMAAFVVCGSSMAPALADGDVVLTRKPRAALDPGEVIAYRDPWLGHVVVHRVARSGGELVWTAGDASGCADGYAVPARSVIGKVWMVIPRLGRLVRLLKRWP